MKKITLILVALITVACSDPKDNYIALECNDDGIEYVVVMDKDSRTFENYFSKFNEGVTEETKESLLQREIGPENIIVSGTYIEEGDHHYLYSYDFKSTEKLLASDEYYAELSELYAEIGKKLPTFQYKIDRRDFSYSAKDINSPYADESWTDYHNNDCAVIDVPEDYLASKRNNGKNLF